MNPGVYYVSEGYGAEAAGIQEGDLITAIDGHRVVLGRDIELYFLNHPMDGSPIEITYERDGESHTVTLDPSYESLRTGFSYYASDDPAEITALEEDLDMAQLGAQVGDVITAVDGTSIASGNELAAYFESHPLQENTPVTFTCERNGETFDLTVTPGSLRVQYTGHGSGELPEQGRGRPVHYPEQLFGGALLDELYADLPEDAVYGTGGSG